MMTTVYQTLYSIDILGLRFAWGQTALEEFCVYFYVRNKSKSAPEKQYGVFEKEKLISVMFQKFYIRR